MKKRQVIIVLSLVLLVASIFGARAIINAKKDSKRQPPPKTARSVDFDVVQNQKMRGTIPITGKLQAKDRVEVFAEVTGNLQASANDFKEGNSFSKGQLLLGLDDRELRLNLQSQKSQFLSILTRVLPDLKLDYPENFDAWKTYVDGFDLNGSLPKLPPASGTLRYFLSTQQVFNQYYAIKSQEARLAKYRIYAPFTGTVALSSINPGTLVRPGQKLGEFISTGMYELETAVPVEQLSYIAIGAKASLWSSQLNDSFRAEIVRISDQLDQSTQTAKVILEISGKNLKSGMYLNGYLFTPAFEKVFAVNKTQLLDDNGLFVIAEGKLEKVKPELVFKSQDRLLMRGLPNGTKILKSVFAGMYNGMLVSTNAAEKRQSESTSTPAKRQQ